MTSDTTTREELLVRWRAAWPQALAAWSTYTMLRDPLFLDGGRDATDAGMTGEIAAIRLADNSVFVNIDGVRRADLEDHAVAVLAHEVGHHVYAPGNRTDAGRAIAAMGRMLEGLPAAAVHLTSNLYTDLLINDRLQRRAGVDMAAVYRKFAQRTTGARPSAVWCVYTRTYEHLWRLPAGTLAPAQIPPEMDADAALLARIVRTFAGDWLRGSRRFATVLYRWLAEDEQRKRGQTFEELGLHDTRGACACGSGEGDADVPDGLAEIDASETEDDSAFDDAIDDPLGEKTAGRDQAPTGDGRGRPGAQYRAPFQFGQLLERLGLKLGEHEATRRYYRERALPHLVPFPSRRAPRAKELLAEGFEDWQAGDPLEDLDVFGTLIRSPRVVPGVTTVQRVYGETPGADAGRIPMDLDLYVDSSGSMPNPSIDVSYLALAATILALSALRAGARVQATLWSGPGSVRTTGAFIRDERTILDVVTGCIGGATAFPLHVLRETYRDRKASEPPAHVVVISDDGCDTMLAKDERGTAGAEVCGAALSAARGGGTLVLNLRAPDRWAPKTVFEALGFGVHAVTTWEDLVAFARAFVRETYAEAR